jgi:glycosyltransferase involved in cell wall biosynthesis
VKIIQVHNYYQQAGGEDSVVAAERNMLEVAGHEVITYYKNNDGIVGVVQLVVSSMKTLWNPVTYWEFRRLLKNERPDVVHCHNTFPLISPAIYWACAKESTPVVQTIHNYRLLCLNSQFFRLNEKNEPEVCEKCLRRTFKFPGIKYRCYRGSLAGSAVVAFMLFLHRVLGTWKNKVSVYVALTEFQKQKMIEEGLPSDKILVKPNFIQKPEGSEQNVAEEEAQTSSSKPQTPYCLFVGRLSSEKGCDVLIRAWNLYVSKLQTSIPKRSEAGAKHQQRSGNLESTPHLLIVGDGPERENLEYLIAINDESSPVHFLGLKSKKEVLSLMSNARFLVQPSLWYEGFPMTIVESFACGTAVVASDTGSMTSIIRHRENGLKFEGGNPEALAEQLCWGFEHTTELDQLGMQAKADSELMYSEQTNMESLLNIYQKASTV